MNVTRNVIIDLLPLYVAGEVSPDSRALVDEYLKGDPELAESARSTNFETLSHARPSADIELRALRRTRSLLGWQRWLMAWAIAFTLLPLSSVFYVEHGQVQHQFLMSEHPWAIALFSSLAVSCWVNYLLIRWRLRMTQL